jgi:hypothetical protein
VPEYVFELCLEREIIAEFIKVIALDYVNANPSAYIARTE